MNFLRNTGSKAILIGAVILLALLVGLFFRLESVDFFRASIIGELEVEETDVVIGVHYSGESNMNIGQLNRLERSGVDYIIFDLKHSDTVSSLNTFKEINSDTLRYAASTTLQADGDPLGSLVSSDMLDADNYMKTTDGKPVLLIQNIAELIETEEDDVVRDLVKQVHETFNAYIVMEYAGPWKVEDGKIPGIVAHEYSEGSNKKYLLDTIGVDAIHHTGAYSYMKRIFGTSILSYDSYTNLFEDFAKNTTNLPVYPAVTANIVTLTDVHPKAFGKQLKSVLREIFTHEYTFNTIIIDDTLEETAYSEEVTFIDICSKDPSQPGCEDVVLSKEVQHLPSTLKGTQFTSENYKVASLIGEYSTEEKREAFKESLEKLNIGTLRFPGGEPGERYNWESPSESEVSPWVTSFDWGITDHYAFLDLVSDLNIEPILQINLKIAGDAHTEEEWRGGMDGVYGATWAAKWVKCVNIGGSDCPVERDPTWKKVTYWEIGNETYNWLTPEQYATAVKVYSEEIKKVDPSVKLIATLNYTFRNNTETSGDKSPVNDWIEALLELPDGTFDYLAPHIYLGAHELTNDSDIYYDSIQRVWKFNGLDEVSDLIKKNNSTARLFVTEWSSNFFEHSTAGNNAPEDAKDEQCIDQDLTTFTEDGPNCYYYSLGNALHTVHLFGQLAANSLIDNAVFHELDGLQERLFTPNLSELGKTVTRNQPNTLEALADPVEHPQGIALKQFWKYMGDFIVDIHWENKVPSQEIYGTPYPMIYTFSSEDENALYINVVNFDEQNSQILQSNIGSEYRESSLRVDVVNDFETDSLSANNVRTWLGNERPEGPLPVRSERMDILATYLEAEGTLELEVPAHSLLSFKIDKVDAVTEITPLLKGTQFQYDDAAAMTFLNPRHPDETRQEFAKIMKNNNIGVLRFPGGTPGSSYQWAQPWYSYNTFTSKWAKQATDGEIEPIRTKEAFEEAIRNEPHGFLHYDNFLDFVNEADIEPILTINLEAAGLHDTEEEWRAAAPNGPRWAANWVKCVNFGGDDCRFPRNPEWKKVKYWEIGNERWVTMTPEQHAMAVKVYADEMKKIDPDIKVIAIGLSKDYTIRCRSDGQNCTHAGEVNTAENWNNALFNLPEGTIDYVAPHLYPNAPLSNLSETDEQTDIEEGTTENDRERYFESIVQISEFKKMKEQQELIANAESKVRVALTEWTTNFAHSISGGAFYNGGCNQEALTRVNPEGENCYFFSLGNGLHAAQMYGELLKSNIVDISINHSFPQFNIFWYWPNNTTEAREAGGDPSPHGKPVLTPLGYALKLFAEYTGERMTALKWSDSESPTFEANGKSYDLLHRYTSEDDKYYYVVVLNYDLENTHTTTLDLPGEFALERIEAKTLDAYEHSERSISSNNLVDWYKQPAPADPLPVRPENANERLSQSSPNTLHIELPTHSMTAIKIPKEVQD